MEKLKSKSPYILIAMASLSFIAFYFRKKIRNLILSESRKAQKIQDVIEQVQSEQKEKWDPKFLEMVNQSHAEREKYLITHNKYGHQHK
jgi:hypothetical protein